ncbi:hypothetical protein QAD02_010354 [Eretmocerus hayati]|uniref:Uncharacterized protein n=1 Tax=Eretmocerus hayati TaxID=131215 RepID=A0ACC2NC69_9HYME|nr:hypothetical protein QAD02_010354 [Eretmocerus hayati]
MFPFITYAKDHEIDESDLYDVLPGDCCEKLSNDLKRCWIDEMSRARQKGRKPSLMNAIIKNYGRSFFFYAIYVILWDVFRIIQVFTLGILISYLNGETTYTKVDAYLYATIVVICTPLNALLQNKLFRGTRNMGMRIKVACSSLIYQKMIRLPQSDGKNANGEKVINLLASDLGMFEPALMFTHYIWTAPLNLMIICYILWQIIGIFSLVCGVFVLLSIPIQLYCGKIIRQSRRGIAAWTDERILLTGEILKGIRLIKMYTWEEPLKKLVMFARKFEIDAATNILRIKSTLFCFTTILTQSSLFIAISMYTLKNSNMSSVEVFTIIAFIYTLNSNMMYFSYAVSLGAAAAASVKRVQEYLLLDEMSLDPDPKKITITDSSEVISLKGVSASWTDVSTDTCLKDLDISITCGECYAIIGAVGSGKSSFLKFLLRELKSTSGEVNIVGEISYAGQEPWLFPGSVKENILFGEKYDEERYKEVIEACALREDIKRLPRHHETFIGENGVGLSGGQCARVNLARAIYKDADIYLLDDPFSAVDSRVSEQIFEKCIKSFLREKTCIFVTHNTKYMEKADQIISFSQGCMNFQGHFSEARKQDVIQSCQMEERVEKRQQVDHHPQDSYSQRGDVNSEKEDEDLDEKARLMMTDAESIKTNSTISLKETLETHFATSGSYRKYFKANNSVFFLVVTVMSFVMSRLFSMGFDYWVAYWITSQEYWNKFNTSTTNVTVSSQFVDQTTGLTVFGVLLLFIIFTFLAKAALFCSVCKKANLNLHEKMISNLLRTVVSFFDTNDSGRILNRFSKDLGLVDLIIPDSAFEFLFILEGIVGVMIQIMLVSKETVLPFILMVFLNWMIRSFILPSLQNLKKLESQARSPVFSHVKSTFSGVVTIRSRRAQSMVSQYFDKSLDHHTAAYCMSDDCLMVYRLCVDMSFGIFAGIITYCILIFESDSMFGAYAGLVISQLLMISTRLQRLMGLFAELSMQEVIVDRLLEYTQLQDENVSENVQKPSGDWPTRGKIEFKNLSLTYPNSGRPILKDLCLVIEPGTKVGIVGRTGAGKTSLLAALFRMADIDGSLMIDDIDTKTIQLQELRKNISILPQEPILFSVSVRENLDPSKMLDDASLWSALQELELHQIFKSLDEKVDRNNLSVGQRQLLCLARVLLKKNKILVFDEATANVDDNTDDVIHKTIRRKFEDCTVLTIAHRLNTVMNSDKILVMDGGRAVEYGRPDELLRKKDGHFYKMVQSSNRGITKHTQEAHVEVDDR